jgi:predicted transcriptional regulator of viral defense system
VLSFYDLSDLNPAKLHMTVPTNFRRSSKIPGVLVLHYADLPQSDVQTVQGFKITRPLRAILDLIDAGTVERNFIRQAITQAVDRGLITRQQIRSRQMSEPARRIFEEALRRAA